MTAPPPPPPGEAAPSTPSETKKDHDETVEDAPGTVERRPRGRPVKRVLPDPMSDEYTVGCSGRIGNTYRHSNWCLQRRGLEPHPTKQKVDEDPAPAPAREAAASSSSGPALRAPRTLEDSDDPMNLDSAVPHEKRAKICQANITLVQPRLKGGDVGLQEGTVMHVPSELDPCVQLLEDFYYDEDDGSMLEPDQVAKGIQREMSFMDDLRRRRRCEALRQEGMGRKMVLQAEGRRGALPLRREAVQGCDDWRLLRCYSAQRGHPHPYGRGLEV